MVTNRVKRRCLSQDSGMAMKGIMSALALGEQLWYCGKDKGVPNGWSFNWESMTTRERGKPRDAFCRKLACCLPAICVLPSVLDAKRQFLCP